MITSFDVSLDRTDPKLDHKRVKQQTTGVLAMKNTIKFWPQIYADNAARKTNNFGFVYPRLSTFIGGKFAFSATCKHVRDWAIRSQPFRTPAHHFLKTSAPVNRRNCSAHASY